MLAVTYAPTVGAIMGETAITRVSKDKTLAVSVTGNKSRTRAIAATMPAQPPMACKNRIIIKVSAELVKAHPTDDNIYKANPT